MSEIPRAILVNLARETVEDQRFQHESLALGYLTRSLEMAGVDARAFDCQVEPVPDTEIIDRVVGERPLLVGICASVQEMFLRVRGFAQALRTRGYDGHIIVGGLFATIAAREILETVPAIDSVCVGEGEPLVPGLVDALGARRSLDDLPGLTHRRAGAAGEIVECRQMAVVGGSCVGASAASSLEGLPFPARPTLEILRALGRRACLMSSRGCVARCSFCSAETLSKMGGRRRQRSVAHVIAEMLDLYRAHGIVRLKFNDPIFIGAGSEAAAWGFDFCRALQAQGVDGVFDMVIHLRTVEALNEPLMRALRDVGVTKVLLGVESGSAEILKWMRKPTRVDLNARAIRVLRDLGMQVEIAFIFFVPPMTLLHVEENVAFIRDSRPISPFALTSVLEIYKGCAAEQTLHAEGNLRREHWWSLGDWRFVDPQMARFWALVEPVLTSFHFVGDDLHLVDVSVQRQKAESTDTCLPREIDRLNHLMDNTTDILAEAYLAAVALVRAGEHDPRSSGARAFRDQYTAPLEAIGHQARALMARGGP